MCLILKRDQWRYLYKNLFVYIGKKLVFVYKSKKKLSKLCNMPERKHFTGVCTKYNFFSNNCLLKNRFIKQGYQASHWTKAQCSKNVKAVFAADLPLRTFQCNFSATSQASGPLHVC